MSNLVIKTEDKNEQRDNLYREFKKNKKINSEIGIRQKQVEKLNMQIAILQKKMAEISFELNVLQEIKNSQKTFVEIDRKISKYIEGLRCENALNSWKNTFSTDNETISTNVYSIKNASYTSAIIVNHNKKRNFYRVDSELSLSSVLLNLAKEHKMIFQTVNDIKISNEGKVVYSDAEANEYVEYIKDKYSGYFTKEKAPIMQQFKDIEGNKYNANDFLVYDDMLIDDFEITEEMYEEVEEEIPF